MWLMAMKTHQQDFNQPLRFLHISVKLLPKDLTCNKLQRKMFQSEPTSNMGLPTLTTLKSSLKEHGVQHKKIRNSSRKYLLTSNSDSSPSITFGQTLLGKY
jgi:hypothetical protein